MNVKRRSVGDWRRRWKTNLEIILFSYPFRTSCIHKKTQKRNENPSAIGLLARTLHRRQTHEALFEFSRNRSRLRTLLVPIFALPKTSTVTVGLRWTNSVTHWLRKHRRYFLKRKQIVELKNCNCAPPWARPHETFRYLFPNPITVNSSSLFCYN